MKKTNFTLRWFVGMAICCLFGLQTATAQINHGGGLVTTCSDNYYDTGGIGGSYTAPDPGSTTTICPTDPATELIQVDFSVFDLEGFGTSWDALYIYDGTSNADPIIDGGVTNVGTNCAGMPGGWHDANGGSPTTITASGASGCLHFFFCADGGTGTGWEAAVTCVARPMCSAPNGLAAANPTTDGADLSWSSTSIDPTGHTWDVEIGAPGFTPGNGTEVASAAGLTATTYTATGLDSDTEYWFAVLEHCDGTDGDSDWSAIGTFTTLPDYCAGDLFIDEGGIGGAYSSNSNINTLICPDNPGDFVAVKFNSFSVEDGWDGLFVYDADSADPAALIPGCGVPAGPAPIPPFSWDDDCPADLFYSTHASGCLTFNFISDGSVQQAGWDATVVCIAVLPEVNITDPCNCNDDHNSTVNGGIDDDSGTFGEEIEITTANVGDAWTVVSVTGLAGTNAGDILTDGGAGDDDGAADGIITIQDSHQDGVGYTIEVTDGIFTLTIGNTCHYPKPSIDLATATFCTNSPAIPLVFSEANGAAGIGTFTINGVAATEIDPAALGAGTHAVSLVFDAGTATSFDVTDPGCLQEVTQAITIQVAPTSMTCNDNVQVSLDEVCFAEITPDMVLEGADGCESSYSVDLLNALGGSLGNTVDASNIGNTYTVLVTEIISGNSCWGSITVEDKLDPVLDCPDPLTIACGADTDPGAPFQLGATILNDSGLAFNGLGPGSATYFDLTNNTGGNLNITELITSSDGPGDVEIYFTATPGTYDGNEGNAGAWTLVETATMTGPFGAFNSGVQTPAPVNISLPPGTTGVALFYPNSSNNYLGTGTTGPITFGDALLTYSGGVSGTALFNGAAFGPPRTLNGGFTYLLDETVPFPNGLVATDLIATGPNSWIAPAGSVDACTTVALSYIDNVVDEDCASGNKETITRTWTAVDGSGNVDVCEEIITVIRPTIGDIVFPADRDGVDNPGFACDNNPFWDVNGDGYPNATPAEGGVPTALGIDIDGSCDITCEYSDQVLEVCPGTTKILRTWTCIDWCAGEDVEENQILKIIDDQGPSIDAPATLDIDVYQASAPAAGVEDVCAGVVVVPPATSNGDNCSGVAGYTTQLWSVDFNCDPVSLLDEITGNGGVFYGVPLLANGQPARYTVRYLATDGCDNTSEALTCITVFDKVPPVAICDEITEITVTNNGATGEGCSTLYAEDLDDGSYDNCKPVWYLMAKMSEAPFAPDVLTRCFYPTRDFCCDEVGTEQQVILLVLDADPSALFVNINQPFIGCDGTPGLIGSALLNSNINYNTCMIQVNVDDKLPPINTFCPADQTITCDDYWDNYEAALLLCEQGTDVDACQDAFLAGSFGSPIFYDNCSVNVTPEVTIDLDQCGDGTITREWSAVDDAGNGPASCEQVITVVHVSDWAVMFPDDKYVNCEGVVPDFGEPVLYFETCELLAVSYEDELFTTVPDACFKLVRQWTVINWCTVGDDIDQEYVELSEASYPNPTDFNGNGRQTAINNPLDDPAFIVGHSHRTFRENASTPDGYITYQQVIKVNDDEVPVFVDCSIDDMCIYDGCSMTVFLPQPTVTDCSEEITITVESTTLPGALNGFGPYVNVGPGTYTVVYKATDNCGNFSVCETSFIVEDCKNPTPYCVEGLIIEIMNTLTPMIDVWASDFDAGSFDNCQVVCVAFSNDCNDTQVVFGCDDIGEQPIQLWVYDGVNWDFCETFVNIQDNMGVCIEDDELIQGNIATETNDDVADVEVQINGTNAFSSMYTTDATGMYEVLAPINNDYTVTPVKDINPLNGVTTFDLVQISKHILNINSLDTPYQMIAADANNSGGITTFDLVTVRKLILYIDTEFANNTSWRFVPADYTFSNPANPFADNFPEVINLNNLTAAQLDQNFVAIKIGDVNGSANANELLGADDRNFNGALTLATEDVRVEAGKTYTVEFTANNFNHLGYQFTINYSGLNFVSVGEGLATVENFGTSLVSENAITASWNKADAVQLSTDEAVFSLTFTAQTTAQLSDLMSIDSRYTAAEAYAANGDIQDVNLEFNGTAVATGFELLQNTPNPFSDATVIGFNLPTATSATITISDISGRVLKVIEGNFAKGYNQIDVTRDDVPATGVLYYQLDTDNDSATKKMILID